MMRVSFSSVTAARAVANALAAYGYVAKQLGREVATSCPTLLAVPIICRLVGLADIERLDLSAGAAGAAGDEAGLSLEDCLPAQRPPPSVPTEARSG
jgi:hypothetical protein